MPFSIFGQKKDDTEKVVDATYEQDPTARLMLSEEQRQNMEQDLAVLGDQGGDKEEQLLHEAAKEVEAKAAESLLQIQKIKLGRCPRCGAHLSTRISANICEECGWNKYDVPKYGKIIVHLKTGETVWGEHSYVLKDGYCLITRGDVVYAKFPRDAYSWIEYQWTEEELEQRRRANNAALSVPCGWCGQDADTLSTSPSAPRRSATASAATNATRRSARPTPRASTATATRPTATTATSASSATATRPTASATSPRTASDSTSRRANSRGGHPATRHRRHHERNVFR